MAATLTASTTDRRGGNRRKGRVLIGDDDHDRRPMRASTASSSLSPSFSSLFMSSYSADGSEYSSIDSDYDDDEDMMSGNMMGPLRNEDGLVDDDVETIECQPVPMSKNAGNRIVALYWDHELKGKEDTRDPWELHYAREDLNEDHVMFCRKCNLYNETFNTDSMVDIMRSLPM
jgi:hypothetical protein